MLAAAALRAAARIPQIASNWRSKATGQLSLTTCCINGEWSVGSFDRDNNLNQFFCLERPSHSDTLATSHPIAGQKRCFRPLIIMLFLHFSEGECATHLSLTICHAVVGCIVRIFTTLTEGGGSAMLRTYLLSECFFSINAFSLCLCPG